MFDEGFRHHKQHHDHDEHEEEKFEKFVREELKEQAETLQEILEDVKPKNTVTGGIIRQVGNLMISIAPGNSPQFAVSPLPAGVKTLAAQAKVTSADPLDSISFNADDSTGLTFTVRINSAAVPPVKLTLTWTYTNTDGSVATVVGTFTEDTSTESVTGGTMSQIV